MPYQVLGQQLAQVAQAVIGLAAAMVGGLGLVGDQRQAQQAKAAGREHQAGQQGQGQHKPRLAQPPPMALPAGLAP